MTISELSKPCSPSVEFNKEQILAFRLQNMSLSAAFPPSRIEEAFGGWVMQNTPPGVWETALHTRMPSLPLSHIEEALSLGKTLIQAWSLRGAPCIFPASEREIFLTALLPEAGEDWIYTRGISGALDHLGMSQEELLPMVEQAALLLEDTVITGKSSLDHALAERVAPELSQDRRERWYSPSIYGANQTMGEAAVSFLLRPCALKQLVVFGKKQKTSPTFTSLHHWYKDQPVPPSFSEDIVPALVKRYLHCYGPATPQMFADTLGCSLRQARRMWQTVLEPVIPVKTPCGTSYLLERDRKAMEHAARSLPAPDSSEAVRLLPPHDPFLDARDRALLLPDSTRQKEIWKITGNPGAILINGNITGMWKALKVSSSLRAEAVLWAPFSAAGKQEIENWFLRYASFRGLKLQKTDFTYKERRA